MKRSRFFLLLVASLILVGCAVNSRQTPARSESPPRLVILFVIDQGGYELISRLRPLYQGGLKYLFDNGAVFSHASHDHAYPVTAPGHAVLATGVHPSKNGMAGNEWFDRESEKVTYCVEDAEFQRSPKNLLASTFAEWLSNAYPDAKVFSVSGKDRGAVILGGHKALGAYWFDTKKGSFISSDFYKQSSPEWLDRFNARRIPDSYFGSLWKPLPLDAATQSKFHVQNVDRGWFQREFPHAIGGITVLPGKSFYEDLTSSPWLDAMTLDVASEIVENESLGADNIPDFLGVSLSAVDFVGHSFGPNSPEIADTVLRLDQSLGHFIKRVNSIHGAENVLIALSSDHGAMPLPEYSSHHGVKARRISPQEIACIQNAGGALVQQFGPGKWLKSNLIINEQLVETRKLSSTDILGALEAALLRCKGVKAVWRGDRLARLPPANNDHLHQLYSHSYVPGRSTDLFIQFESNFLPHEGDGTDHVSPYEYDRHVPVLFFGSGIRSGTYDDPIATVDLPVTLAGLLGIDVPKDVDGRDHSLRITQTSKNEP